MDWQSALLLRAAVCGRLMDLPVSPEQKQRFRELRDACIALAYRAPNLSSEIVPAGIAAVEEFQSVFDQAESGSIH
jgi:hypothetical protein